ncbi:MAG TPA: DNA polymerase III subunit alpha [Patescibacteria group bacterium]|nr:DNA polymerase III subunit alpha [Patescibacteria group bacterium]
MAGAQYLHLHNHSEYSLLDGAFRIRDLVDAAREMEMGAVALTDHGNLFGAMTFYWAAEDAGVKPIIGMETYVAPGGAAQKDKRTGPGQNDHLVLLVKNEVGYRNLLELSSIAYLEGFYYKPRIDLALLERFGGGLIGLSGCLQGGLSRRLRAGRRNEAKALAERFAAIFGKDDFYVEIQNHGIPEEIEVMPLLVELAREMGLPIVATNDCHFKHAEDHEAHDVLLCLQTGKDFEDPSRGLRSNPETYFKTPAQMVELFADYPEAVAATLEIADKCNFKLPKKADHLPSFPIPAPFKSAEEHLERLVMESLPERMPAITDEVRRRIEYELDVISRMGFAGYFLIVWDIVHRAREMGIPVGPGRGSAAGSLVCYTLGITSIDPLENGLLFERLLNPERVSMPDIDIDFCDERRQEVIDYVVEKYGKENVCQIITFGRMAARAVVRDVGRVLKVPYAEVDKLAKMIPGQPGTTLSKALSSVPELKSRYDGDATVKRLIDLSFSLEGLARHASTHAAGLVITPSRLVEHVPLFRSNRGEVTTQYEMKILERIGILKIDILGLKTLSHIDKTLELVHRHEGAEISMDEIPLDDPETFELLREGGTVSVFQLESTGMRDLLRRIEPSTFGDVTAVNALYRPGPLGSDMVSDFIECKHGRKAIEYEHPLLEPILRETYGVILYQEQVMRIASELAGFTLGQADLLRRAMSKKKKSAMERQRERFMKGAVERGIPKKKAHTIFDLITFFSGYGFNKSHSAAYAVISMQTAYLKAHHPAAFMAAAMTCDMADTNRLMVLLDECRSMDLPVHPPDINSGGVEFGLANGEITYGLAAIKNVGVQAVRAIVEERRNGPYTTLFDFCNRVDLRVMNRRMIESLIQSGTMDCLPGTRSQKTASLERILGQAQKQQIERARGQTFLGFLDGPEQDKGLPLENVPSWDDSERLHRERESLGFYFSGHPLDRYREILGGIINIDSVSLQGKKDREAVILAGLVSDVKVILDRKGNPMAFVTVEDFHGSYEVIVFSTSYGNYRNKLQNDKIVVITGKVSVKEKGNNKVIADYVYTIDEALRTLARTVHLTIASHAFGENELQVLKEAMVRFPGEREVIFHWKQNGNVAFVVRSRGPGVTPDLELLTELEKITGVEHVEVSL